jgi:hypothetical protein
MTQLAILKRRLRLLWWCRAAARWFTATAELAVLLLTVLLCLFFLDWLLLEPVFRAVTAPRVVAQLVAGGVLAWLVLRFVWPSLRRAESTLDMALLVERNFGISSDLIAALQFESPSAGQWGSPALEAVVIRGAAERASGLNVLADFPLRRPARMGAYLVVALVPWVALATLWPDYLSVFANRFLLGSQHYPTATRIETLEVNGQSVLDAGDAGQGRRASHAAQGDVLTFRVRCAGHFPESGTVSLTSLTDGRRRTLPLQRVKGDAEAEASPAAQETAFYQAELGRFVEPLSFQIALGDAWTDPAQVQMIALPMVRVVWSVRPPDYARSAELAPPEPDSRQLLVLEGSQVALQVQSVNEKQLTSVWMDVRDDRQSQRIELRASPSDEPDDGRTVWRLPEEATVLQRVTRELRFELQVTDQDGLQLDSPLRGSIRLRRDRPPSGTTAMVHRVVLPDARPVLEYRLSDDYGIADAVLRIQIQRKAADGALDAETETNEPQPAATLPRPDPPETNPREVVPDDSPGTRGVTGNSAAGDSAAGNSAAGNEPPEISRPVLTDGLPITAERLPAVGRLPLDLSGMDLQKGDRLKITMELTDDRGPQPGETYRADPLYLEISDESGVLDEISKADERSEKQLTDLIKQQLGIGDGP